MLLPFFIFYVVFCYLTNETLIKFFNLGIKYKYIPRKMKNKETPIYNIIQNTYYEQYCSVEKYDLLYRETISILKLIVPYPIIVEKLKYVQTFRANPIKLFVNYGESSQKRPYEELVSDCEDQLRKYKDKQIIKYREKKSLDNLNKVFNDNYVK